jgi:pilus assembly protein Flp/PilA
MFVMRMDASLRTYFEPSPIQANNQLHVVHAWFGWGFRLIIVAAHFWKGESTMWRIIKLLRDEEAATAVEYAVMLAMILVAIIGAVGSVGERTGGMWGGILSNLTAVGF